MQKQLISLLSEGPVFVIKPFWQPGKFFHAGCRTRSAALSYNNYLFFVLETSGRLCQVQALLTDQWKRKISQIFERLLTTLNSIYWHYYKTHAKCLLNSEGSSMSQGYSAEKDAHPQRSCHDHNRKKTDHNHVLIQLFPHTLAIQVFKGNSEWFINGT